MATENKEDELKVQEGQDGTATVELPEGILPADDGDNTPAQAPADDGGDEDHPDDSDAVRAARRARRRSKKELIRNTNKEKDVQLQMLRRQNEEMMNRLARMEQRTQGADLARIDKTIEDQQVRLEYHRMKLAEATSAGDGESAVKAQEALFEARQQVEQLARLRKQAEQGERAPAPTIDPAIQANAATWIERNSWYKPDLSDTDSKIAKQVDEVLAKEGFSPSDPDYWDELDNRLQKYLPHRYNDADKRESNQRTPRNTVGSSGREASAAFGGTNRTFTLSAEQVRAMKDAGMWDNPEKRAKMIKRYAAESRNRSN
jgi:hypothetical protein